MIDDKNATILDDLIYNLVLRFKNVINIDSALDVFSQWLNEYSLFFKGSKHPLSKSAQRGLIGELIFLKEYAMKWGSIVSSLNAWRGHDRKIYDFSFPNGNVEIKTTISKEPKKVIISTKSNLTIKD